MAPIKKDVKTEDKVEVKEPNSKERQLIDQQTEIARLDIEKSNKDMLLMTVQELKQHILDQKNEIQRNNLEIEGKYRALTQLENEIKAQNYNLNRQKDKFEADNAERIRVLEVKQTEIDATAIEYNKLMSEINTMKNELQSSLQSIADERRLHENENARMKKHVYDVETQSSKNGADITDREQKLKEALEKLEAEKAAIEPEFARISSIKNENNLLFQKIDEAQAQVKRQTDLMDAYKAKLDADAEIGKQALAKQQLALQNNEARLRKWEQDLNDQALEVRAREAEAQKMMKRYQLTQVVESAKE